MSIQPVKKTMVQIALALLLPAMLLAQDAPSLRELVPATAPAGARVLVSGRGLADPSLAVTFAGTAAAAIVVQRTDRAIEVVVPANAVTGNVRVTSGSTLVGELPFTVATEPRYIVSTLAGGPRSQNNPLKHPWGAAVILPTGNVAVADEQHHRIILLTPSGQVSVLAGDGKQGLKDGKGTSARFKDPRGIAFDVQRDVLYVSDSGNHAVRQVALDGTVTTLAGHSGKQGYEDGPGSAAKFKSPHGLTVGGDGAIYVADTKNHRIRRVALDGTVTTFAGTGERGGQATDGPRLGATFNEPRGIVAAGSDLYIADTKNNAIRKISEGQVTTVLAFPRTGDEDDPGDSGDGNPNILNRPSGIGVDDAGNLIVSDSENDFVRRIALHTTPATMTTIAGTGRNGFVDGDGAVAQFKDPVGLTVAGAIYLADEDNDALRRLCPEVRATGLFVPTGALSAGTAVRLFGTGFVPGGTSVTFDGVAATNVTWINSTAIAVKLPQNLTGGSVVVSITACGGTTQPVSFVVDNTPPVLTITNGGAPLADASMFRVPVTSVITAVDETDPAPTVTATLNGVPFTSGTTVSADGIYTLAAIAEDAAGNRATQTIHFTIDATPPVVEVLEGITPFPSGAFFNRPVVIDLNVADLTSTTHDVRIDGAPYVLKQPYAVEGPHELIARVTDALGNETTIGPIAFTIDTIPPALAFTSHGNGQIVSARDALITGGSDDAISVKVNGADAVLDSVAKTFSFAAVLLEGENVMTATAVDRAGNAGTASLTLVLDTRAPELTIDATPACTNAASLDLRGTIVDPNIDKVEVRLGDTTVSATVAASAWSATLSLGDEGSKAILVEGTDSVGHVNTRSVTVVVDRTAPAIEISESGTPFTATLAGRAVALFVRANDADPSNTAMTTLDGTAYTSGAQVAAEGEHTIRVVAKDCAGNESTREHTFIIDLTAPRFLTFTPASGSKVTQVPSALGGTTDTDAVEVRILGTDVTAPVSNGAFTIANAGFAEGVNDLTLEVTDRAGHTGRASYTLGIRTAKPLVEIIESGEAIVDGAVYRRAIEPRVRVFDPEVTFTATLNGAPFASGSSISTDGAYTIAATATDPAYGQTNSVTRTFTIDRTGPAVDIVSPAGGTIVDSDRVDVRVTAADAASVSVNANAATKQADGSWLAPAVPLDLGENTLVATGRDAAGNTGSDSIEVTRGGAGPALVLAFPPDLYVTNRPILDVIGRVLRPDSSVSVTVPPSSAVSAAVDAAGGFRLSGAQLGEGEWTILATATEGGKSVEASARVIADFTPPRVQILESGQPLTDGAGFATQAVLSGEASDKGQPVDYVLVIDGNAVASPVTIDAAGGHSVVITARDAAGNESRLERTFFIGSAGAGGCRLEAFDPPDLSVINSQRVELVGRSGGAAGVKVNGVAANMSAGSFCANVELPQEGSNSVTIQCTDAAGEPVGDPVVITLIRATDEPSVSILTPVEDFVTPDELLDVTGTLGNGAVSVAVNGKPATITGTTWTATGVRLQDGINVLVARAKNIAGKTAVASRRVTFLADAPSITITAPVPGFITGSPTVNLTGTWINVDLTSLVVEGLAGAVSAEAWSDTTGRFSAAAVPLQPGDNTIRISGRDRTGRIARAEVLVKVEPTLPAITIAAPADNHVFAAAQGTTFRVSGSFAAATGSSIDVNGVPATIDAEAKTLFANVEFASTPGGITPVIAQLSQPSGGSGAFASIRVLRLTDAPRVLETFPIANAVEVDSGAVVLVLFSAPMERASTAAAFTLENVNGTPVSGKTYLDKDVLTFAPAATLVPGERYTIRVATGAKDLAGQSLAEAVANAFVVATTAPATAPTITTPSGRVCAQLADVAGTTTPGARVRIDYGQVFFTTTASATGTFSYKVPLSGQEGFHVIRVRTIGADGALSPAAELKLTVDCSGPRVLSASYDRTVNQLTIVFSREVRPESLTTGAAGTIQLVLTNGTVFDGAVSVTGANAIVTPSPTLAETSFTLRVTTGVEDTQGRKLELPHTQHFPLSDGEPEAGDGRGTIAGEVYDATTGRPLAGAEITIEIPMAAFARTPGLGTNATPATQAVTLTTDARGRYADRFPEGAHTIRASASGYTTVWRQIIVPAGAGVIPIDIRLTRVGEMKTASTSALALTHGGGSAVTRRAELTIPAGAVPAGTAVTLTSTGAQSLPGLLPLGWSPLAAAVVVSDAVALPGSTLTFDVPQSAITAAAQTLTAVRYDESRDEWNVLAPVVNVANDKASFDVAAPGAYALVYGDRRPGLASPPPPSSGAPLQGVVDACIAGACPPMVARSFPLDPPAVLPTGSTVATLEIEGQDPHVYPSGTAVQAYIDEELRLTDGGRELDPPFATDLLLYRDLDGNTGVAAFHLAPSPRAAEVFLEVGFDHIRVVPYPGRLDRGTLVGPEGGRVPADDKVAVEIPTGATPVELRATASSIADPDSFGPIAGYTIIGGVQLSLQHIEQVEGEPLAPVELTRPARATFTVSTQHAALSTPPLLVELLDQTPYGNRMFRLAAEMTQLDAARWTTKTIDRAVLPVDGIIREGRYLLLAPQSPIAFAKGLVRIGATGAAAASARVITPGLGVADLTRLSGIFALPVPSAPAGPFTLVPRTVVHGDGATYQHATAPAAGAVVNVGDLVIVAQPPQVSSTIPASNATSVSLTTSVEVSFTPGIDPSSVGPSTLTVIDTTNDTTVAGTVTAVGALGVRWTLPAGEALVQGRRYVVAVAPAVRGANGTPLGQPYTFRFTTASTMTNDEVHPERIRITIPDANGVSRIIGAPGALVANWLAVPVRRGRDFLTRYSVTVAADGSFTLDIGTDPRDRITVADEIDLRVLNVTGALTAIVPLTPFVSEDGRAFVASTSTVTFTSADGIGVTVPAGAFDAATVIRVEPAQESAFAGVPRFSDELRMSAAVTVTFDGRARRPLELKLPALAGADLTRPHFLGILGQSSRGPRIMAVDPLYAADGALTTERPSSGSASPHRFATNAQSFQSNDPGDYTQGVIEAGQYAALDMRDVAGSQGMVWAFMDGVTAVVELIFDALHSMFVGERYIAESRGRIAFPIPSGVQFTVTGIDPATSLIAFEQTYSALPVGDPGVGTTIPNPATDFAGPHPVYGTPFRIERVSAPPADLTIEPVAGIRLQRSTTEELTIVATESLPEDTRLSVLHVATGVLKEAAVFPFTMSGVKKGDELVLMIERKDVDPDAALSIVFNEAIDIGETDPEKVGAVSDVLKSLMTLESLPSSDTAPVDVLLNAVLRLDSGNRRVTFLLPSTLPAGADLRLTLDGNIQDRSGNGLGLGQAGKPSAGGSGITPIGERHDIVIRFSTRKPKGTIAEFDIRQSDTTQAGQIREIARYDNLMFVAALDGGILAYDLSDPAALDDSLTTKPEPVGQAPAGITDFWTLQVDRHGRVFAAGTTSYFGVLRTYRVEDFINAKADPNDDCMPSVDNAVCRIVGGAAVSQTPGSSSTLGIASAFVVDDRVEAIPRKVKIVVGDAKPEEYKRDLMINAFANGVGTPLNPSDGFEGLVVFHPKIPATSNTYRLQRITIENVTLGLRWSADAKGIAASAALAPAEFHNVIAGPNDILTVTHNLTTHGVVSLFGFGIGLYDLNAVESNDYEHQVAGAEKPKEEVGKKSGFSDLGLPPESIGDIRFSPDSEILATSDEALRVYALDGRKGVVQMNVQPSFEIKLGGELIFTANNPRFEALKAAVLALNPSAIARFNSSALYRHPVSGRSYVLLPAVHHGLLIAEVGSTPLSVDSFADAVWLPEGANAVRVIDRGNLAVIVDGRGYAHLLDLTDIDERGDVSTPDELFPTVAASVEANALDPRILWTSDAPIAQGAGFIPPLVDPDTGMMYSADLLGKRVRVGSVKEPKIRIVADVGGQTGLQEVGSIVPLGIEPPRGVLKPDSPNASLAAFRVEVSLPGSMRESMAAPPAIAVESERVAGLDSVTQTPLPYPRAHLRQFDRAGAPAARATVVTLRRALDDAAFPELRYQRGYNRFVSDWIVAIADPRAAKDYGPPPPDCVSCIRPALDGASVVHELFTGGRFIAVRPELTGLYSFLAMRMAARVTTTPADTVRPLEALVAAQHPPVAEGMLQETTYLHSGELETSAVDYDAGGRAGWNVVIDRTYRSRTIGLTPFGSGWDSTLFRRLRALPNGDVEYRDGAEVWRFRPDGNEYAAPEGVFLRLARQNSGWSIIDQRQRIMRFDDYGRIVSESDEFYDPRDKESGNTVVYLYGADGRLTHVVDPLDRATTLAYDASGRVKTITDWREAPPRAIDYDYTNGVLTKVELPNVANTSGGRPTIRYAYEASESGYKQQLELATNLSTITDPGISAARVDFAYDAGMDRVTSQTWATGESASFSYNLPASATVTDVLGQLRLHTFTGPNNAGDPLADRAHASAIHEEVEVWTGAPAGQLPAGINPVAPAVSTATRTRQFTYDEGALKSSKIVDLRETEVGWESVDGAPGVRLKSHSTTVSGEVGGGGGASSLSVPSSVSRVYHYQAGAGAFLQAIEASGKTINVPEPHRYQKEPTAANDSIDQTQKFDKNGRLFEVAATGGTDSEGAGASRTIVYWGDDAAKHMCGLPRIVREGSLATTYQYPSETTIVATDPRLVKTTTELDTWNRPKHVRIEKPGDPLTITESYTYDASGRVHSVTRSRDGGDVTTTYSYDDMGRQREVSTNQIATVGSMTTKTTYDLTARRITTESPGGAVTTIEMDRLGRTKRSLTNTGSSPIEQQFAYDIASNRVFSTDLLSATASAYDIHGREKGTMHADATITVTDYDEWHRPTAVRRVADDGMTVVGESTFNYTDAGRLTSTTTKVDADVTRSTSFAWDGGGRTTGMATSGRASRSVFDENGRLLRTSVGAGDALQLANAFVSNHVTSYDGWLPQGSYSVERGAQPVLSSVTRNAMGLVTESTTGPLQWKQSYDEVGNIKSASVPGRPASTFQTDARGAIEIETLPDDAVNQYGYHASGAQALYTDPANEPTSTTNDLLGRPTRRDYADATNEIIEWEGSRVKSVTDRQGRKQTYSYNSRGQLLEVLSGEVILDRLDYDTVGRLVSWKNADSEVTWSAFDMEGRPKKTTQTRFRDGSGFESSPEVLDQFEQSHTYNEHGERTGFTMPAYSGMSFGPGWTQSVDLDYDAMGNVTRVSRGGVTLMTASYRNAGRPQWRTVQTAAGGSIVRNYRYDAASSLLNRMEVEAGGITVAGSAVEHDGLQLSQAQLLGVSSGERYTHWRYDVRSRVATSVAGVKAEADPSAALPGRAEETQTVADFRSAQPRISHFDDATAANLEAKGVDTIAIDPPTATFQEELGHKIAETAKGTQVRSFSWNGAERVDDGRFVYEFDAKGRLLRTTEKNNVPRRRFIYAYGATGRMVGRRAEYTTASAPTDADWKLEDRAPFLDVDGLPAETTFVWDAITDNLVAIFRAAPAPGSAHGGLLKQIIHGDAGYDDPIETTSGSVGGSVTHLYPIYDEAGAGSLQIVLNGSGKVVARTLPNDPYGGEYVDFKGAAIDRVELKFNKNSSGVVTGVDVTIRSTEQLDPFSLATGVRLATVDAEGNPVRTAPMSGQLDESDPFTARWTLNPEQLAALIDPSPVVVGGTTLTPVSLSVAATDKLRAAAWAVDTPIMPAPEWAVATRSIYTTRHPFEVREPLASLHATTSSTLYAVESLSLLGLREGDTLIEKIAAARFQALPLTEPATGLVYARRRWYDPGTGTFLSPDPMGYADSSNLYVFCGGDPVNCSDPTGEWGDSYKKIGSDLLEIPGLAWKHLKQQGKLIDRLGRTERRDDEGRIVGVSKEWRPDTLARNVVEGTVSSLWTFTQYASNQKGRSPNEKIANAVVTGAVEESVDAGTRFYHADEQQQREMIVGGTVDVIEQILLAHAASALKAPRTAPATSAGVITRPVEIRFPATGLTAAERELFATHLAEQEATLNRLSLAFETDLESNLANYPNLKAQVATSRKLARGYLPGDGAGLDAAHALDAVAGGYAHEFVGFRNPIQERIGALWRARSKQIVPGREHRLVPVFDEN